MIVLVSLVYLLIISDKTSASLEIQCTTTDDCMKNANCTGSVCICNEGFVLNSQNTKCLPYATEYRGSCEEDSQCDWLGDNAVCKYNICKCQDDYRWFQGACKKYVRLGETCVDSSDCYDGYNLLALSCTDQVCSCSDGFYLRDGVDCRVKADSENDACALDIDCHFDGGVCILGKCQKNQQTKIQNSSLVSNNEYKQSIEFEVKSCTKDEDCGDGGNFQCYLKTKTCTCKKGYFLNADGECVPELGVSLGIICLTSPPCPIKGSECKNGACYCRPYWFNDDGNRNCIKTIIQQNWNCLSNEWCYALGQYSYCSTAETCECSKIATLDKANNVCEKTKDESPDCVWDYECHSIQNSFCRNESCLCNENYREEDKVCLPNLGAPCTEQYKCTMEHSSCVDGFCKCNSDFVAASHTSCLAVANLDESCQMNEQCTTKVPHSECLKGKCACQPNFLNSSQSCIYQKNFGDYCESGTECLRSLGETVVCRRGICQCPTYYTYENGKCTSLSWTNTGSLLVVALFAIGIQLVN